MELASDRAVAPAFVPQARNAATSDEIRTAIAEALAEEREREMAEARAFWAAQEARDAADAPSLLGEPAGPGLGVEENGGPFYVPRQADLAGLEALDLDAAESLDDFAARLRRERGRRAPARFRGAGRRPPQAPVTP